MNCPTCKRRTKVVDVDNRAGFKRRRRECFKCGHRFSTREVLIERKKA